MDGLYDGMPCDFRALESKGQSSSILLFTVFLHFYSFARLKLVLLVFFIFFLVCIMISIDAVCVCTYMWPCIVCILELFNSKSCPKSCTAVALQSYSGKALSFAREEEY